MVIFLHCNGEITVNKTCSCSLQCYNTHFNISLLQIKTVFLSQNQWQYIFFSPTPNLQGILRFPEYTWDTSSEKYTREVTKMTNRWSSILYNSWKMPSCSKWIPPTFAFLQTVRVHQAPQQRCLLHRACPSATSAWAHSLQPPCTEQSCMERCSHWRLQNTVNKLPFDPQQLRNKRTEKNTNKPKNTEGHWFSMPSF